MKKTIECLTDISRYAGLRVDYTQGGGGNTSCKTDDKTVMLIKASGYKLKDVSSTNAFVAVDQKKIYEYYDTVDANDGVDHEKESAEISKNSVIEIEGLPVLRPSVEVGFHSILKKFVIHTHSVYANVLACSIQGEELAKNLFKDKDYGYVFLPYINPGFELTLTMKKAIADYNARYGKFPEVIFMKNHGLVVTADNLDRVKDIHTDVNLTIEKYFNLGGILTEIKLQETKNGIISHTDIVKKFIKEYGFSLELLNKYPLYPDQLVYLNNCLVNSPELITVEDGLICYHTDIKQATVLEETLSAYAFVVKSVKDNGLTLSLMSEKEVSFINNWEAEKYRRSVK